MAEYRGFLWNFAFSWLIFITGGFGMFVMRFLKGAWSKQLWTYIPIFWIPLMSSWIISLTTLFGLYD